MSYSDPPASVRLLEQRIRNLEGGDGLELRRRAFVGRALSVGMEPGWAPQPIPCFTNVARKPAPTISPSQNGFPWGPCVVRFPTSPHA